MTYHSNGPMHENAVDYEGRKIAKNAAKQSENNNSRLDQLELTVKNLSIINEALYELLATKLQVTEAELVLTMNQVVVNRKDRAEAKLRCSSCSMHVPASRQKCIYCGGSLLGEVSASPFDISM